MLNIDSQFFAKFFQGANGWLTVWVKPVNGTAYTKWYDLSQGKLPSKVPTDADVYFGVCTRKERLSRSKRGGVEHVLEMPGVWADVDFDTSASVKGSNKKYPPRDVADEVIASLPLPPSVAVSTGGGYHVYWLFPEPIVIEDDASRVAAGKTVEQWQARIRQAFGKRGYQMDSTHDLARVLRVPGSRNTRYRSTIDVRR